MKPVKKLFLTGFTMLAFLSMITACHTMQGAGQDIQAGGHAISKAATIHKDSSAKDSSKM